MKPLLTVKYTEEESCVATDSSWQGTMRDDLEQKFGCAKRDEHITRVEVFETHVRAFFAKGPRP
jgi:hypothetical protein